MKQLLVLFGAMVVSGAAVAQTYPDRIVRLVVPFVAGSSIDTMTRILAQSITAQTKQQVIVDNHGGANGFIGSEAVKNAAPNGYTVLITANSTQVVNRFLFKQMPYDPIKDFVPVTTLSRGYLFMVVHPKSRFNSVREFVAAAKQQPGKLTFASGTALTRFAGEMIQQTGAVQLLHVPFKSVPPAITDLMGGQVDTLLTDGGTVLPLIRGGKLRALGVTSLKRVSAMPELPTLDEQGLPGFDLSFWAAAYLPAGTPANVVSRLGELLTKGLQEPAAAAFFVSSSNEPFPSTSAEAARFLAAETEKWARIVKAAGVEPE